MSLKARPHMNGNTRDDFVNAALALSDALSDVYEAFGRINADVLNGRNYQHLPQVDAWSARDADVAESAKAMEAYRALRSFEGLILQVALESE